MQAVARGRNPAIAAEGCGRGRGRSDLRRPRPRPRRRRRLRPPFIAPTGWRVHPGKAPLSAAFRDVAALVAGLGRGAVVRAVALVQHAAEQRVVELVVDARCNGAAVGWVRPNPRHIRGHCRNRCCRRYPGCRRLDPRSGTPRARCLPTWFARRPKYFGRWCCSVLSAGCA